MPGLETLALTIAGLATTTFTANLLYIGTYALVLGGLVAASTLLVDKPSVPKPEDGSFNLKQNVPSLAYVLGWVKKGGDYAFLEEVEGDAFHVVVHACHRVDEYIQHYLHDEKVILDVGGAAVVSPEHFDEKVYILERLGLSPSTAYTSLVDNFPTIWSEDHRGDGIASVFMRVNGVNQKDFLTVYPNNMPEISSVIAGMPLYDPRNDNTLFTRNLALMRYWHVTAPVGGRLTLEDLYTPEWENAANVCDSLVTNRNGDQENRYYGGFWFRANNDPTEVGRIMDQAAEMVVYERADGLVGVHAGEFVEPDIRLEMKDIISVSLDANTRDTSTVLAVRGRYTRIDLDYATSDAAIYGDPYIDADDTERTKTIDNQAIQSHNHIQRLQKIAYIRANAARVSCVAHYEAAEEVPYRRFVRINHPPKLNDAIIEITESPVIDLENLTVSFAGIVVPSDLYSFDAEEEEGEPGNDVENLPDAGIPVPSGFNVTIQKDNASGVLIPYGRATWNELSDKLTVEVEYEPTDMSDPPRFAMSDAGNEAVRTGYLDDGLEYRFRARSWGGGNYSGWTSYVTRVAVADTTAPKSLNAFSIADSAPHFGHVEFSLTTKNDAHLHSVAIYRVPTGDPFDPDDETPVGIYLVNSSSTYSFVDGDSSRANLVSNSDFASDTVWTKGSGWTIAAGKASHSGASGNINQAIAFAAGTVYRYGITISDYVAGNGTVRFINGTTVIGPVLSADGIYMGAETALSGNTLLGFNATGSFVGSIDDFYLFVETSECTPQGVWDYYAVPFNPSGVAGPESGPLMARVY